jgi:hypothetical protein
MNFGGILLEDGGEGSVGGSAFDPARRVVDRGADEGVAERDGPPVVPDQIGQLIEEHIEIPHVTLVSLGRPSQDL